MGTSYPDYAHAAAQLRSFEGHECIYKENTIFHARVRFIAVNERGVKAEVVPIPSPGLIAPKEPWLFEMCDWQNFSWDARSWTHGSPLGIMQFFFDQALIREIKQLGEKFSATGDESQRREKLVRCIHVCQLQRLRTQPQSCRPQRLHTAPNPFDFT
jgi:hypothetical protein